VLETSTTANYVIRRLQLTRDNEKREAKQFQFTQWLDRDVPEKDALLAFRNAVAAEVVRGPMVVHCSAGVGRTGAFIALDTALKAVAATTRVDIDVTAIIQRLRENRPYMVQTWQQVRAQMVMSLSVCQAHLALFLFPLL
jgi:protein tyrosine phosphatase